MQVPKVISHEKPLITIVRSDKCDEYLKDIRCVVCGGILLQSYSGVHAVIPGIKPRKDINKSMFVIDCKNKMCIYTQDGRQIQTRCNTRYLIT
jgi:hypothetical protein